MGRLVWIVALVAFALAGLVALLIVAAWDLMPAAWQVQLAALRVAPFAYFVVGLFAGGVLALSAAASETAFDWDWSLRTVLAVLILFGAALSIALGHPVLHAATAASLAIVAVAAGDGAIEAMDDGDTIGVSSHWGGLGGGLGGWQISRATGLLLVLLVAALAAVAFMWPVLGAGDGQARPVYVTDLRVRSG